MLRDIFQTETNILRVTSLASKHKFSFDARNKLHKSSEHAYWHSENIFFELFVILQVEHNKGMGNS